MRTRVLRQDESSIGQEGAAARIGEQIGRDGHPLAGGTILAKSLDDLAGGGIQQRDACGLAIHDSDAVFRDGQMPRRGQPGGISRADAILRQKRDDLAAADEPQRSIRRGRDIRGRLRGPVGLALAGGQVDHAQHIRRCDAHVSGVVNDRQAHDRRQLLIRREDRVGVRAVWHLHAIARQGEPLKRNGRTLADGGVNIIAGNRQRREILVGEVRREDRLARSTNNGEGHSRPRRRLW